MTFHIGDVLSLNAVDRSAVAVQQFLNRDGYLEAAVDPETNFSSRHSSAPASSSTSRTGARAQRRQRRRSTATPIRSLKMELAIRN